jgi:hypothetical protein
MYLFLFLGRKMVSSLVNDLYRRGNILKRANRGIGLLLVFLPEAFISTRCLERRRGSDLTCLIFIIS